MTTSRSILPSLDDRRARRAAVLFTVTASLTLALTGVGLFEGNVVYPSWYDLAAFDGFAAYHTAFGQRLIPWLPVPLLVATILNGLLLRWRPPAVPRAAVLATFILQIGIGVMTVALAIPLQTQLGTAGYSPAEVVELLDQLTTVSRLREVPGVVVALAFVWMLHRQLRWRA
ncbi:MAG: hypothetical protein H7Y15_18635 [Pseudonocardia sp.]|nr:hypothetical protein [Pseudonocardia sp.]